MSDVTCQTDWTGADEDGLARVLIDQLWYHEAMHHPADSSGTIMPKAFTLIDIYKLIHQGEFGMGHFIDHPLSFKDHLAREFFRSGPLNGDPLLEKVSPDGATNRLNLRPFRRLFMDDENQALDVLFQVCLNSASQTKGEPEHFLAALKAFRDLNLSGKLVVRNIVFVFPPKEVDLFLREIESYYQETGQILVLSHSQAYRKLNKPSYRVVELEALKQSAFPGLVPQ